MPQPFEGRDDEGKDAAAAAGPARPPSPPAASERAQAAPAAAWEVEGLPREALANPVVDRVLGCLYGNALGDAYGLSTEFLNAEEVARMYPDGAAIPFPDYQRTFHSSRWKRGDWTDDTDQMILITQALVAHAAEGEAAVARDFAARLRRWAREGFPELGDTGGAGLGFTVGSVISHPRFLEAPHEAARAVWEYHRRDLAANGAVMRTSVLGCYRSEDLERVRQQTEALALVTHTDPRCVASCVAVTRAIAQLVRGRPASTPEEVEALLGECAQYALRYFDNDERRREFLGYMGARSVADLRLDEPRKIGYTLKCAGSGFFVMRSGLGFKEALLEVVRQGGDADT
jgi:ADP-ribosylglycohydrolase